MIVWVSYREAAVKTLVRLFLTGGADDEFMILYDIKRFAWFDLKSIPAIGERYYPCMKSKAVLPAVL